MISLERLVSKLSPDLQQEVQDFAEFLLNKRVEPQGMKQKRKLRLHWAGALSEFRDQFTSLDLQKKSLQWWGT